MEKIKKKNKIDFRALYFKNIPWYRKAEGKEMKKGRKNCANLLQYDNGYSLMTLFLKFNFEP